MVEVFRSLLIFKYYSRRVNSYYIIFKENTLKTFLKILVSLLLSTNLYSQILIIDSYHNGYKWSDDIISGLKSVLEKNTNYGIDTLYMDSKRVTSKEYYLNLEKLYKIQLEKRKYDLVIAIDRFAYDFILDIYDDFFQNTPLLAVGIENFSNEKAKRYKIENKISALLEKRDLKRNVRLIEKLMPTIKKLYIINDKSLNAKHTEPLIKELFQSFHNKYELIYLKEDSLDYMKKRFSKKEKDSAILFIRLYKNNKNKLLKNKEISSFIKGSMVPIFITDSIFINKGAVGGKIIDLFRFGKTSGYMALDILNNKKFKVNISKDLYYVFDYQKLNEFDLPFKELHIPYELLNKKLTFYDKNRGFINFIFTISPFLLFLILGLVHTIYIRKRVEKDLKTRMQFDEVLLNAIENPIFWQDENDVIIDSNIEFCILLQLSCKNIYGHTLEELSSDNNILSLNNVLKDYDKNKIDTHEYKYISKNTLKTYLLKQAKYFDERTNQEGTVTIFTDITREKEIAEEKQRNRQFIIQQSKLAEIGEVFSSIAHQWKSPLVEITAIAQELFYSKQSRDIKEDESFVSDIMMQVNYMTNTINDFQKFIMPSTKKIEFNIYTTLKSLLDIVNHNMKYNNIKINLDIEHNCCLLVTGYKNEFMQSFLNLINNAKDALLSNNYKNRNIFIKLFNKDEFLYITIEDNAGGIDEKNIKKIFDPYYSTKKDGHGIGLYMSKMIIEDKMQGIIYVENKNDGAFFTIKLGCKCENTCIRR